MIFENDIRECLLTLESGGLILYPTDTVWGIGCDATNDEAVLKIYNLKRRNDDKSMIVLLADEKEIEKYVGEMNPVVVDYIKGIRKPTTVIYESARGLSKNLINKNGSIAIRIVKDKFCSELIKRFGKPIVSTSANISGYPPARIFPDIDIEIKSGVDYIVQHRQDDLAEAAPSAIVKWEADGSLTIIRS